jgi:hypothetical protein
MALGAPDLASLLVYDYYPARAREEVREDSFEEDDGSEYSVLPHLYAYLTSSDDTV